MPEIPLETYRNYYVENDQKELLSVCLYGDKTISLMLDIDQEINFNITQIDEFIQLLQALVEKAKE